VRVFHHLCTAIHLFVVTEIHKKAKITAQKIVPYITEDSVHKCKF
jgi:hypothetical protein